MASRRSSTTTLGDGAGRAPGPGEGGDARTIGEALAYKARVGNRMEWCSTANSPFGSDMGAPPNGGFQVNVFLRVGDAVYRTYNMQGRGVEQLSHAFPLIDLAALRRQEEWQDSPAGWPQAPTCARWASGGACRYADTPD